MGRTELIRCKLFKCFRLLVCAGLLVINLLAGVCPVKVFADEPEEGSLEYYMKLANQGDPDAAYSLGSAYRKGQGVAKDPAKAAHWIKVAAENGNGMAQIHLGWMYENGDGWKRTMQRTVKWYGKAAEGGTHRRKATWGRCSGMEKGSSRTTQRR